MAGGEFVAAQASVLLVPTLGKGANSFQAKLKAELKRVKEHVDVDVRADFKKFLAEVEAAKELAEKDPVEIKVKEKDVTKRLTEIRHKYQNLNAQFKRGLTLNMKVMGLPLLKQAAPALAALDKAVVDLSQSVLLLPGAFASAAAGLGTLKLGVHGMGAAFKALNDERDSAIHKGRMQRAADSDLAAATRNLSTAVRDARRNLQDLNDELRDAPLDEADAVLRLQEAYQDLGDTWGKSASQHQRDQLQVLRAENNLADVRKRNLRLAQDTADANAKGVANADGVTAAYERLGKAQDKAQYGGDKLADSMAQLSPNAQAFVRSMKGVLDQWDALRNHVQDNLFAGLDSSVTGLADTSLPMLKGRLGEVSTAINGNLKAALGSLGSSQNQGFIDRILGNSGEAQRRLSHAMDPLISAFLRLTSLSSDSMPRLVNGVTSLSYRFGSFIERAEADGSFKKWTDQGIKALTDLGNTFINLGSMMNSVSEALSGSGGRGMLEKMADGSRRMADFLKSAQGQGKLQKFFRDARAELAFWKPVLKDIVGLIKNVSSAGQGWAQMMMPFLKSITGLLKDHPGLVKAIMYAYLGWKTIQPIIGAVNSGLDKMSGALDKAKKKAGKGAGLSGTVRTLATSLGPTLLLNAAVTLATYMGGRFVSELDAGTRALDRQKQSAAELSSTLDQVTGKSTQATQKLMYDRLANSVNEGTQKDQGNLVDRLNGRNVDVGALTAAAASGDKAKVDELLAAGGIGGVTADDVRNSKIWQRKAKQFEENGVTPELAAAAVNGDPAAVQKYAEVWKRLNGGNVGVAFAKMSGFGLEYPDLLELQNSFPEDKRVGSQIKGELNQGLSESVSGGSGIQQASEDLYGKLSLTDTGARIFGSGAEAWAGADGVHIASPNSISAAERERIESDLSGRVTDSGDGSLDGPRSGSVVIIPRKSASEFVTGLKGYAGGGFLSGPGSGTSDSMLARVSNGEFISRAGSVAKYGRGFYEALNAGTLPAFKIGGVVPHPGTQGKIGIGSRGAYDVQHISGTEQLGSGGEMRFTHGGPMAGDVDSFTLVPHFAGGGEVNVLGVHMDAPTLDEWGPIGSLIRGAGKGAKSAWRWWQRYGAGGTRVDLDKVRNGPSAWDEMHKGPAPGLGVRLSDLPGAHTVGSGFIPGVTPTDQLGLTPGASVPKSPSAPLPAPSPPVSHGPKPGVTGVSLPGPGGSPHFGTGSPGPARGVSGPGVPVGMPRMGMSGLGGPGGAGMLGGGALGGGPAQFFGALGSGNVLGAMGSLPQNIQPQSIAQQFGQVLLSSVLGFFGIDPTYINLAQGAINQGIGLAGRQNAGGAGNPFVDQLMGVNPYQYYGIPDPGGVVPYAGLGVGSSVNYGQDGFPDWVYQIGQTFKLQASTYAGHQEGSGSNKGIDWSGSVEDMQAFAEYLASTGMMEQVIWNNPNTGQKIGVADGQLVGPGTNQPQYYADDWSDHTDHVHTRMSSSIPMPGGMAGGGYGFGGGFFGGNSFPLDATYQPGAGAEQWRPLVEQRVNAAGLGSQWVDPLVQQIQTESGGNPFSRNGNDSNGLGGTQSVMGLFNFLPSTFTGHGGSDIWNPVDQIDTAISYVGSRYGVDQFGVPNQIGRGSGFARGGLLSGAGSGTSDSMLARVSNGEFITRASAVAKYGPDFYHALNSGLIDPSVLPAFGVGGLAGSVARAPAPKPVPKPAPKNPAEAFTKPQLAPGQVPGQLPSSAESPQSEQQQPAGGVQTDNPQSSLDETLQGVGAALGGEGAPPTPGAEGPEGSNEQVDPRSILGAAPVSTDHNNPALDQGIQAGISHIGQLAAMAAGSAPVPGLGAASSMIAPAADIAGQAAASAVNVLSSFLVGTVTPGTTQGAYGAPVLPQGPPQSSGAAGPGIVNNYNGGIHTANLDEFYRGQQRREAQQQAPLLPMR